MKFSSIDGDLSPVNNEILLSLLLQFFSLKFQSLGEILLLPVMKIYRWGFFFKTKKKLAFPRIDVFFGAIWSISDRNTFRSVPVIDSSSESLAFVDSRSVL